VIDFSELTRDEKLLVIAAMEVEVEENTFSGHNTAWVETVDLVLEGRRGLFDYTDEELDGELSGCDEIISELKISDKESLLLWARKLSRIDSVSSTSKSWKVVPKEQQEEWDRDKDPIEQMHEVIEEEE
jgi:hypothetical protein